MSELVCCITLTRNRPSVLQTIGCYCSQNYPYKHLAIMNTGDQFHVEAFAGLTTSWEPEEKARSIGWLRNHVLDESEPFEIAPRSARMIAHFDDDDWSAPDRLSQQVALMELTGRPVVGYYDMAFYDSTRDRVLFYDSNMRNYALGTSLMYRREVWEKTPFPDQTPEDTTWQFKIGPQNIASISSIRNGKPMMIQIYHGGNAAANVHGAAFSPASPELDREVRRILGK